MGREEVEKWKEKGECYGGEEDEGRTGEGR